MTVLEKFYKVGPGPSSLAHDRADAHYLRLLPALHEAPGGPARQSDGTQGALFGSLSATGKGAAGRAAFAGLLGEEPATVDPLFSTRCATNPISSFPLKLCDKTFNLTLEDIVYDATKGDFHHPTR